MKIIWWVVLIIALALFFKGTFLAVCLLIVIIAVLLSMLQPGNRGK
jgi:hypothetical protein